MLSSDDRRLYARHLLLAELGEAGQARLCASRVSLRAGADARAAEVARDYLQRAGVGVVAAGGAELTALPSPTRVAALAGDAALHDVAADLAGAFAAVEAIKAAAGVGTAAELPDRYVLTVHEAERSDDPAGKGAPGSFAARGEGSRDPSPGRANGPTKEPEA